MQLALNDEDIFSLEPQPDRLPTESEPDSPVEPAEKETPVDSLGFRKVKTMEGPSISPSSSFGEYNRYLWIVGLIILIAVASIFTWDKCKCKVGKNEAANLTVRFAIDKARNQSSSVSFVNSSSTVDGMGGSAKF